MGESTVARGRHAPGPVAEARAALLAWVREAGDAGRVFLEVQLLESGSDRFRIRHRLDAAAPAAALACTTDPYAARDIARTTDRGDHRPLKTAPNLRRGWSLDELDGSALWIAIDYLYPACAVHWHAERTGTLQSTSWPETAARQSGIYSAVRLLPESAIGTTIRACCADAVCLRRVRWHESAPEDDGPVGAQIPCPEACSIFISFAKAVLGVEREARHAVRGLGTLNDAELSQIRQIVSDAAGGTGSATREGEFELPTNPRRTRYLAFRLAEAADEEQSPG